MLRRTLGFAVLIAVAVGARYNNLKPPTKPSRYLYVWAGAGHDSTTGLDMITVLDANPASYSSGSRSAAVKTRPAWITSSVTRPCYPRLCIELD